MNNSKPEKIHFEIVEVNTIRKMRTDEYIRVRIFEDEVSVGCYWQTPKLIKRNLEKIGTDSYINKGEHINLFKMIGEIK